MSERKYNARLKLKQNKKKIEAEITDDIPKNIFHGLKFVLVVDPQEAPSIKKKIIKYGGSVGYIVTKETTHVVTTVSIGKFLPFKLSNAIMYGAALISEKWIDACLKNKMRVTEKPFMIIKSPKFNSSKGSSITERKREIRLFVSSTFRDMQKEREELITKIFPQIKIFCENRGVQFSYVDLRWGITKEQSIGGKTLETCLNEIDKCRPYFISFLGERYGWAQPEPNHGTRDQLLDFTFEVAKEKYPWISNYTDRSITELEIIYGALLPLEENFNLNDKAFFYFRDPLYLPLNVNEEEKQLYQNNDKHSSQKMSDLKDRIRKSKFAIKENYRDPQNFGDLVLEDLKNAIENDCPDLSFLDPLDREREHHQSYLFNILNCSLLRNGYNKILNSHFQTSTTKPLLLFGGSASGKSSIISHFIEEISDNPKKDNFALIYHFVGSSIQSLNTFQTIRRILSEMKEVYQINQDVPQDDNKLLNELFLWIKIASKKKRKLVLVIDGIDSLDQPKIATKLVKKYPKQVTVILSSRTEFTRLISSKQKRICEFLEVNQFNKEEKKQFIEFQLSLHSKKFSEEQLNTLIDSPFTTYPLFVKTLLDELCHSATFDNLDQKIEEYLKCEDIENLFIKVIERFEKSYSSSHKPDMVKGILSFLAFASTGLTESELLTLLDISSLEWVEFSNASRHLLPNNSGIITFCHDTFAKAVKKKYHLERTSNSSDILDTMISYFAKQPFSDRKLKEYPQLLEKKGDSNQMREFVRNIVHFEHLYKGENRFRLYDYLRFALGENYKDLVENMYNETLRDYTERNVIEIYNLICQFMQDIGNFGSAANFATRLCEICKEESEVSVDLCKAKLLLSSIYEKSAKYDLSKRFAEESLDLCVQLWSSESMMHLETANSYALLGLINKKNGKYEDSERAYEKAVRIAYSLLGNSDGTVLAYTIELADVYRKTGRYEEALNYYSKCLETIENSLGKQHPLYTDTLRSTAVIHKKNGNYPESQNYYNEAIQILSSLYGKKHPKIGVYLTDLGDTFRKQENHQESMKCYHEALKIIQDNHGHEHPDFADILNSISLLHKKNGNYQESLDLLDRAIKIISKLFSNNHIKVGLYKSNYADVIRKKGSFEEAMVIYEEALQIIVSSVGEKHEETANVLISMGMIQKKLMNYDKAKYFYERALKIYEGFFSKDHYKFGSLYNNLGDVYRKLKKNSEAMRLYNDSLRILTKAFGSNHTEVADVLFNIAIMQISDNNLSEAQRNLETAINIVEFHYGLIHYKKGLYLNRVADIHVAKKNLNNARVVYEQSAEIIEECLGKDHAELADVLYNLSKISSKKEATTYASRSVEIVKKQFGSSHPKFTLYNENLKKLLKN